MPHPNHTKDEIKNIFSGFGLSDASLALCELADWELDLIPVVDGENVVGELSEEEKKFASLLQCIGKDPMIREEMHPLATMMLVEEFWRNVRDGHKLGNEPLALRQNGKIVSLTEERAAQLLSQQFAS